LAIVAGVFAFGENLETLFDDLGTAMGSASTAVTTDAANITSQ
jgi:Flp pilus assembly pilin Flp